MKFGMTILTLVAFALPAHAVETYTVGPEDILVIDVLRPDKINYVATVGPDGAISFPYIGTVYVKGYTLNKVQDEIRRRLADGYMKYPDVAVSLKESHSKTFFISGEVMKPGTYPLDDTTTVLKAVSLAGGFAKNGSFGRGKIIRPKKGGGSETLKINIRGLLNDSGNDADLRLQPGDTLVVLEDKFFVQGDVAHPGPYPIEGNTTVLKAISLAGGVNKSGAISHAKVIRPSDNETSYETFRVNIKGLMNGSDKSSDVLLKPGDTVVIADDKFYVYGAVANPGTYTIYDNVTVMKAISMVGGFTKYGSPNKVKILRPKKNNSGYESIKVDMKAIMKGSDEADIPVKAGDTIVISEGLF